MTTYRIIEMRGDERVIHHFEGDNTFELDNAVDAIHDASGHMTFAEVECEVHGWCKVEEPGFCTVCFEEGVEEQCGVDPEFDYAVSDDPKNGE
jgi:hypothetical protein